MRARTVRLMTASLLACVGLAASIVVAVPSSGDPRVASDPAVVTEWNAIASRTISENAISPPVSALYFGFVSIAVYDAVVAIHGRYEPYDVLPRPHAHASSEVAAATAAYRVLAHFFPASADALAADYAASLSRSPRGVGREHGERVGRDAAAALIASREGDGRDTGPAFQGADGIGLWKAPAGRTMLAPWLGGVRPLTLISPTQMPLPGPDAVTSAAYATDFREAKEYGASTGSLRTPEQTATARFWTVNATTQYHAAMRQQVTRRGLDIVDSARAFALLGSSTADALISCWRAKVDHNFWRPDAAIRQAAADGNEQTEADPGWTPLVPNPPYPDYPSGHACVTGAASGTFGSLFGATRLGLEIPSLASTAPRQFDSALALDQETMNARIWLGIHFRRAMTDGNGLGHAVASWASSQYFQPMA